MDGLELLTHALAAGIQVEADGETLRITGPPTAKALANKLIEWKEAILPLLSPSPQDAREPPSEASPALAAGDDRAHAPYIARCPWCEGTRWGPTGRSLTEMLRTGEQVQTEIWHCLNCASRPEGTRPAPVPETLPPGTIDNPCPQCGKPHRLRVPGSPDIPGEPPQDVLICGGCGHRETIKAGPL